jgi:hypothetical protein
MQSLRIAMVWSCGASALQRSQGFNVEDARPERGGMMGSGTLSMRA